MMYRLQDSRRNTWNSTSTSASSTRSGLKSVKSVWGHLSQMIKPSRPSTPLSCFDLRSSSSISAVSSTSTTSMGHSVHQDTPGDAHRAHQHPRSANPARRHRKSYIEEETTPSDVLVPPYSPTYCKPNEFPYSNFYIKLPNGKWMVRYRSGHRDILGTDELEGYMI